MSDAPATRASLLVRLRDARDGAAWREFVDLYAPVVYAFACKQGLQDADAADLTQEVLGKVAGAVPRFDYDPGRGSFRGWLFTIARNGLRDFRERQHRHVQGSGDTAMLERLEQQPSRGDEELAAAWEQEFHRHLLRAAADKLRDDFQPATWQAFWRTAVDGHEPKDVARELGLTVAAVYLAKSRVMARVKKLLRHWQDE